MSICVPCNKADDLPVCLTADLTIGTITSLNTAVLVYFRDTAIDQLISLSTTSDGSGVVKITDLSHITTERSYEIWVTLASATNIEARETITIESTQVTCIEQRFINTVDNNNTAKTFSNMVISL